MDCGDEAESLWRARQSEFLGQRFSDERVGQNPGIRKGSPSSIQQTTDQGMLREKLPEAKERSF